MFSAFHQAGILLEIDNEKSRTRCSINKGRVVRGGLHEECKNICISSNKRKELGSF